MKRVCFVSFTNLYLCPYIDNYLRNVDYSCDIYVWNRHGIPESKNGHKVISFEYALSDNASTKGKKLLAYFKYRRWLLKQLKKNNYDLIIFLQSVAAVFLAGFVRRSGVPYVVDIRDYSIEGNPILFSIEKELLKNSKLNVISSPGYKEFLPKEANYVLCHNYSLDEPGEPLSKHTNPLRLSYIGLIRFHEENKKIIDLFMNDNRFAILFVGKNALELSDYVAEKKATNIQLIDVFPPEETLNFVRGTDCILNVYGNENPLLDYALSNKLYLAAAFRKPIIVSTKTFMEKYSLKYGFGFSLDFTDPDIKEKLLSFYQKLDSAFETGCARFISDVIADNLSFNDKCKKLFE